MADFLMKPKIDFAFKEIMMDEKARVGFLSGMGGPFAFLSVQNVYGADHPGSELLGIQKVCQHQHSGF